jgi:hypothetical protein
VKKGAKVYVTKYTVTQGVLTEYVVHVSLDLVYVSKDPKARIFDALQCKPGVDVFSDKDKAMQDAEMRVTKKIISLKKQIARLKRDWNL